MLEVCPFVRRKDDKCLRFIDSFDIAMIWDKFGRFVRRSNDLCLRFSNLFDSFNVCATVVIARPDYPFEWCDLQGSLSSNLNVLIG